MWIAVAAASGFAAGMAAGIVVAVWLLLDD